MSALAKCLVCAAPAYHDHDDTRTSAHLRGKGKTHARTHAHTHTCTHPRTHPRINTHTHTHTHTQFDDELYKVSGEGEDKYLIATSEQVQQLACVA
jgi:hypothetical protein